MSSDKELRDQHLVFYRDHVERIDRVMKEFLRLSGAKSALLVDKNGHMITRVGEGTSFDQDTISALVAGSFAATKEMARLLGENEFSALYHQGQRDNIQLSLVDNRTILTVIFDEGTTLGMVRLYVADVISKLSQLFQEMRAKGNPGDGDQGLNSEYSQSAKNMLNSLFDAK
jgi:predicted regulator of Ras-like GTPase activity (Roadblock/LC7/MglB family)